MSAIAALKGYRTQFLYSLHYILSNQILNIKFRLEGLEDLDILDENDTILKIIQVKNLRDPLVLSDLLSSKINKTSFLKRYIETKRTHTKVEPIVISFGSISNDLKSWQSNPAKKEKNSRLNENEWREVKKNVIFKEIEENQTTKEILDLLESKYPTIDPIPTAEILLYWLSYSAEKQQIISSNDLFNKIESIAYYLSERIASQNQYGKYISPLHLEDYSTVNFELLKDEFYRGINARYEHIINNLDIERPDLMDQILSGFKESNVIILQGASGQGKSTIAYRYAYSYAPSSLVYEVNIQDNAERCREAILSIKRMTKSLSTPVLFLIHVSPNSVEWIKIIQELSIDISIYFLITIRQEDWYKSQSAGIKFSHKEIEITLSKNEASEIYERLNQKYIDLINLNFEEAWIKFGERGPLLEFIYIITKGESLDNTLKGQLAIIEKESQIGNPELLTLLRIVSLADSYGTKISAEKLINVNNIQTIIKRLEKEYLIKVTGDKRYITGLHPQRSKILINNLFDDFVYPRQDFALQYIDVIEDSDIYFFILHLSTETSLSPEVLISKLNKKENLSWTAYYGVFRSLLWIGIKNYISENENLLNLAYEKLGDSWSIFVNLYFGETENINNSFLESYLKDESIKQIITNINNNLSSKDNIFKYVNLLLTELPIPSQLPKNSSDWLAIGQSSFWINKLNKGNTYNNILLDYNYEEAFNSLEVEVLSYIMSGLTSIGTKGIVLKEKYSAKFINKLRLRYEAPEIIIDTDEISGHYIIDIVTQSNDNNISLNDRSVGLISLLRKAFPEKNKYSSQGYGHRLPLIPLSNDETHKSIPAKNLPLDEWVEINAVTHKLYEYSIVSPTWKEFYDKLYEWELNISKIIREFNNKFQSFYDKKSGTTDFASINPLIFNTNYQNLTTLGYPKSIRDPFATFIKDDGYKIFKTSLLLNPQEKDVEKLLIKKYDTFFKAYKDYQNSIENFIRQSGQVIHSILQNTNNPNYAIDENIKHISQINLFKAIETIETFHAEKLKLFKKYIQQPEHSISEKELYTTAYIWKQFYQIELISN